MTLDLSATGFSAAMKVLYPKGLAELLYPKCPLLGWMNKSTDFVGESKAIVPFYGGGMGSTSFSTALANKKDVKLKKFLVTRVKDYALASVDAETILASGNDKGAVARALDTQIRGHMYHMARSAGFQAYSDGTGRRATGDSSWTTTGNTVTLLDSRDIVHFEAGMVLQFESSGGVLRSGTVEIDSVDREAGAFDTVEADVAAAVASVANSDFVLRAGDKDNCAAGLSAWVPSTVTATSFFGVDRTADKVRLGGQRYTGTSSILEEVVIDACAQAMVNGASPTTLFLNPLRLAQMNKSQYAKTAIDVDSTISGIKYKALSMATGSGSITMIADSSCPYATGWLLEKDTWDLCSLKEFPHFAMDDGKKFQREASLDGIEMRIRAFWNIVCTSPMKNMRITW